eukprot:4924411-Pleurochrysis_carterae.AAC.1
MAVFIHGEDKEADPQLRHRPLLLRLLVQNAHAPGDHAQSRCHLASLVCALAQNELRTALRATPAALLARVLVGTAPQVGQLELTQPIRQHRPLHRVVENLFRLACGGFSQSPSW